MDDIRSRLITILKENGVDLESSVPINQQVNSIGLVELVLGLEQEFHFEMSPLEYDPLQFTDINTIMELLHNKSVR